MKIATNEEREYKAGPEAWFTGAVWINSVVEPSTLGPEARLQAALVTFTPGARTAWHTHPRGQTLYVVSGAGWAQKEGEPARSIRAGDVVVIPAGENHWHGADATHILVHLAMQESDEEGVSVVWGREVSAQEYEAAG